jgi:hypothetical protein
LATIERLKEVFGDNITQQIMVIVNNVEDGLELKKKHKPFQKKLQELETALAEKGLPPQRMFLWSSLSNDNGNEEAYEFWGFESADDFRNF